MTVSYNLEHPRKGRSPGRPILVGAGSDDIIVPGSGNYDVNFGNNQTITLQNVNVNALHATDFIVYSQTIYI